MSWPGRGGAGEFCPARREWKRAEIVKRRRFRVRMRVAKGTVWRKGRKEMAGIVEDFGGRRLWVKPRCQL